MNFFIDNNLPPRLARGLNELYDPDNHSIVPLRDKFQSDTIDLTWISELSNEGNWIIITHDNLNKGLEREALRKAGLLVFFLDKSWGNHKFWDKASQLVRWWPNIVEQSERIHGGAAFKVPWNVSGKGKFEQLKL